MPACSLGTVCHFLHEIHCEYYLTQLGSSDPYHPAHNSVYKTWRKRGHGAHFWSVCVFTWACACVCILLINGFYVSKLTSLLYVKRKKVGV